MQIFIKSILGKTHTVSINENETIEEIKNKINQDYRGFDYINISYYGKFLDDSRTVKEYNIEKESTLFLTVKLVGG